MKIPETSNSEGFELSRATFLPVNAVVGKRDAIFQAESPKL